MAKMLAPGFCRKEMKASGKRPGKGLITARKMRKDYQLYLMLLPAILYFFIFCYIPMYGVQIAFKDFIAIQKIEGSAWVGLKHFERLVTSPKFPMLLKNTLTLSIYSLFVGLPLPIILALALNEVKFPRFKKLVQTVTYAPHFISVVVLVGMIQAFFQTSHGIVNQVMVHLGMEPVEWLANRDYFKHLYVWSGVWQSIGWSSIIYLSQLSSASPELREAAELDGANRFQVMMHVNLPCIMPAVAITFIMSAGRLMSVGYEKVFLMQNNLTLQSSEIISTYVYKVGLVNAQYSFSTAVNLMNSIVNIILLVLVNYISRKVNETSMW